ncbi:hypothetical protein [Mycolicibacterium monacense]|uniref:Transmembrane protein n=1 Tax=Mycolicibacterium monacense TaxID=85693 RepID=A0AAD1N151_MYCMB|nr:hypothetical protein [Mycolicibacterium monacense]BBZ62556.1 hypothetical protein MMON_38570 [Mycolicibacterium monacense]
MVKDVRANDIDRWFERTGRRQHRTVSLYGCLLTGKMFEYFRYRLRYALLVDGATFVVHVAEFLIILTSLGGLAAFTVMILRVGSLIVTGAWWGLLEVMRERLRGLSLTRDRDAVEREISSWLVLSLVVATGVAVAGAAVALSLLPSTDDPRGLLYALLVVLELALRMPVRVLHSGMYATRRIYRPLWTLFAPTAVQIVVIGAGVFFYPAAAVVVAIIVANALSIWITVHFALRLYRLNGVSPRPRAARSLRDRLPRFPVRQGAEAAVAGLGLRLDAIAVLAIAGIYGTSTRSFDLTAGFEAWRDIDAFQFFYLVLPLLRGAYEATAVFYFDFVRLRRIPALREYRVWFFHRLLLVTPVVTLYFWGLAVVLGLFVLPGIPFTFLLALLPLFIVRSFIGTYQVRLFAEGQFRALNLTIAFSAVLFALVWIDANPASDLVELTAAMITLLIVHINRQHLRDRIPPSPTQLPLGDWIRTLAAEPGPVRAGTITVPEWIPERQRAAAIELMRSTLTDRGSLAFCSATSLVFYVRSSFGPDWQPHLEVQTATGGAANRGQFWREPAPDGRAALDRIMTAQWLKGIAGVPQEPQSPECLAPEFLDSFPDGMVADLDTRAGAQAMRTLDEDLVPAILPAAMKSLDDDALVVSVAGRWLSPIFYENKVRMIFLLPPNPEPAQFQRWLRTLRAWRLGQWEREAAVHGA